jgi:hypothetical protein
MKTITVLASALGLCFWGCASLAADQARAALPYAKIYQRATNEFPEAAFFKPAEPKTNDLTSSLAPLILQEVNGEKEPLSRLDRFGALSISNGVFVLDRSRPAIYWQADSVQLHGRQHRRLSYLWCYTLTPADQHRGADLRSAGGETSGYARPSWEGHPKRAITDRQEVAPTGLPLQGIRVTLNSTGQPVIWEVLADSSGAEVIYVSQSLEAAAAAEFGKPLPGRRYAIERSLEEAPNVVVARIIDDGPVAMGPIVYLGAGTRAVTTLICRCMPAQAKKLLGTSVYDLLPAETLDARSPLTQVRALTRERTAFWPGDKPAGDQLELRLRLPSSF